MITSLLEMLELSSIILHKTYLDSSTPLNDNSLQIEGYSLVRADHPNDVKRGGVCIYYGEPLPVSKPYLKEAVLLELVQNNNKIFV